MKNVLVVDCCIRRQGRTRELMESFIAALPEHCRVTRLRLEEENLSCLTGAFFEAREALLARGELGHPRFRYAHQFAQAEEIVVAAPFWDLSFPALLKVYIEQVSVDGITFRSAHGGLQGLCKAQHLVYLTTRGGVYTGDPMEMGSRYMDAMHSFFGIKDYICIAADAMDTSSYDGKALLRQAKEEAAALAGTF